MEKVLSAALVAATAGGGLGDRPLGHPPSVPSLEFDFLRSTTAPLSSPEPGAAVREPWSGSLEPLPETPAQVLPGPPAWVLAPCFSPLDLTKQYAYRSTLCPLSSNQRDPGPEQLPWTWD